MGSEQRRAWVSAFLNTQAELGLSGLDLDVEATFDFEEVSASPSMPTTPSMPIAVGALQNEAPAAGSSPISTRSLHVLEQELAGCMRCGLHQRRTSIVFGTGNPQARLMFIGEAPGRDEDLQGEPFVGRAGQLLNRMIQAMGLSRQDVYIANIVKCRPPQNRDPQPDEVAECEPFLHEQIAAVQPEVLVALGRYAAQTLTRSTTSISRLRGKWHTYRDTPLMPTFHPAYLLRNPENKRPVWMDLQEVMKRLGLPTVSPQRSS